jgi:hypothetical protein
MAYLNANIPPIYCQDTEGVSYMILKNIMEKAKTVWSSASASITGKALLFHIMLPNGAVFYRLPISAFFKKHISRSEVPDMSVDSLQLWNCFSYYPSVHCFDWLSGISGKFLGKDKKFYKGQYLFTVDWAHPETNILNTEHSEIPQEHKCAHIIELENGNYAAQPNNRIIWHVNSYTTKNNWPDYKVQNTVWNVEGARLGNRRF